MVWIHQENLQLYFKDINYFDRFLWWDIRHVRIALQINSNLAFSSALSSAPSTCTYSEKVIPAPIRMEVHLNGTLPMHCLKWTDKTRQRWSNCKTLLYPRLNIEESLKWGTLGFSDRLWTHPAGGLSRSKHIKTYFFTRQEGIQEKYAK